MGIKPYPNFFMKAKKSLGQNFLIDNNVINKIIDEVSACKDDLIIEIGPGRGALTSKLKNKGCNVIAYELDNDLSNILSKLEDNKLRVIYGDFLKSDIKEDIKDIKYNNLYLVGNLPYYITTPIIEHIIDENLEFSKFTIMIQKEVADRFMAEAGTKDYGYITLVLKYYFNISKVCDVSKYAFSPVPKVESSVVSFVPRKDKLDVGADGYFKFLKNAFRQKRKNLRNNLNGLYDLDMVLQVLNKYSLDLSVRAECLSEEILVNIYKSVTQ